MVVEGRVSLQIGRVRPEDWALTESTRSRGSDSSLVIILYEAGEPQGRRKLYMDTIVLKSRVAEI